MAVLKYRNPNGEFVEVLAPLNVIENIIEPSEPDTPVVPDVPVEPEEPVVNGPMVTIPNMYHQCTIDEPVCDMEINTKNFKTLSFEYYANPTGRSSSTKSRITIEVCLGGRFVCNPTTLPTFTVEGTQEKIYILQNMKKQVEGTYTLDVEAYDSIVIRISSLNADSNAYSGEAGYVIISDFIPE